MGSASKAAELIGDIYDLALDNEGWPRLPALLAAASEGNSANVAIVHESGIVDAATCGLPQDALARYRDYYYRTNPYLYAAAARGLTREVTRGTQLMPDLQFRQTEFYFDFARGFDTVRLLGVAAIPLAPGYVGEIGIHRGARDSNFSRRHVERLEALRPHLTRALQLRLRLGETPAGALGLAALNTLEMGCIICDGRGRIIFTNAAAESLARSGAVGLGGHGTGVTATQPEERRRLEALIAAAAAGSSGGPLILTGPHGARLFALVARLPPRFGAGPGHVLIALRSAAIAPALNAASLQSLFQLTPAEARLALAIVAGQSLREIGERQGVSENTLRTQLAAVLRKTNVANQRELVRLLGLFPSVRLDK